MTPRDAARLREEALAIKQRFAKVEAQQMPVGGAVGNVLAKSGPSDFQAAWVEPSNDIEPGPAVSDSTASTISALRSDINTLLASLRIAEVIEATPGPPPTNSVAPIASGTGVQGQAVTVSNGVWTQSPTGFAYQWKRQGVPIAGEIGTAYFTVVADAGLYITCDVTAVNIGGSATATSNAVGPITAIGDVTPPTLSSPVGTQTSYSTADVGATTNEANGTLFYVVTTSSTTPTVLQVEAGQSHLGVVGAASGSQAISTTGVKTFGVTGLASSTTYYAHLMHKDAAGNRSAVVASTSFSTSAVSIPALTLARTSADGAAPITFSLTTTDISKYPAGQFIRLELSTSTAVDGSGRLATPTQSILHQIQVSEIEDSLGAVDFTDAFFNDVPLVTPTGAWAASARGEWDNGALSPWATPISGTVTAAVTVLSTTTGTTKNARMTVTGVPALSFAISSDGFSGQASARASTILNHHGLFELKNISISQSWGGVSFGLGDGTGDMTNDYYRPNKVEIFVKLTGLEIRLNGTATQTPSYTYTAGDVIQLQHNTATGIGKVWLVRAAVRTQLGTNYTASTGNLYGEVMAMGTPASAKVNFGQETEAYTLDSGVTFYG